jgi:hypothetical protein
VTESQPISVDEIRALAALRSDDMIDVVPA